MKLTFSDSKRNELYEFINKKKNDKSVFGHDEDGRCSVNTSFISKHAPVYFDNDSYEQSINSMIDYFESCLNSKKSILGDSLRNMGFLDFVVSL